jgi:hypothetical protein
MNSMGDKQKLFQEKIKGSKKILLKWLLHQREYG